LNEKDDFSCSFADGSFCGRGVGDAVISAGDFLDLCAKAVTTPREVEAAIKAGADVNAKNNDGATALMLAALNNPNPEIISLLLNEGADVNAKDKDNYGGHTVLMLAGAYNPNPEVVSLLLDEGEDVNA
jgi:ankyrin repeat protein